MLAFPIFDDSIAREKCASKPRKLKIMASTSENVHPNVADGGSESVSRVKLSSYEETYRQHWSKFVDEVIGETNLQSGSPITAADVLLLEQLTAALSLGSESNHNALEPIDGVRGVDTPSAANELNELVPIDSSSTASPISESEQNAAGAELVALSRTVLQQFDDNAPQENKMETHPSEAWSSQDDELGSRAAGCSPAREACNGTFCSEISETLPSQEIPSQEMPAGEHDMSIVSPAHDPPAREIVEARLMSAAKWIGRTIPAVAEVMTPQVTTPRTGRSFVEMRPLGNGGMSSPESISSASDSDGHESDASSPETITLFKRPRLQLTHTGRTRKQYKLKFELHQHQHDAVSWMQQRERGDTLSTDKRLSKASRMLRTRGGVLADDMGLGKTVCCLAVVVEAQANEQRRLKEQQEQQNGEGGAGKGVVVEAYQTCQTLVVAPLSLLGQWEKEIKTKTNLSVYTHHGKDRARAKANGSVVFDRHDVVLTTYDTLKAREVLQVDTGTGGGGWRRKRRGGGCVEDERDPVSLLHTVGWGRVVLDEAHLIANPKTARFKAACALKARVRWCLSGTPIQNSKDDLQVYSHTLTIYSPYTHHIYRVTVHFPHTPPSSPSSTAELVPIH
jgi:hypothetical protein